MSARRSLPALALLAALALPAPAAAQVQRAFAARSTFNGPGSITLTGNTVMTCSAGGSCANAQNGSGGGSDNNDNRTMVYVDVDADATTFSSSNATLTLPPGASVIFAGLYWGGTTASAARNTVKMAAPGGGYATYTATQLDAIGNVYQGFVDVTSVVRAAGGGSYQVANVLSTPNTSDVWGGWSLVVLYRLDGLTTRNLVVADGFAFVRPGNPLSFTVSGFLTPPTGTVQTSVGQVSYDGDAGFTGEDFILNGTTLFDALNPANNVYNSTLTLLGTPIAPRNPSYVNQLGFDADILAANGVLANGTSSATIDLRSASDRYYPGVITFNTEIYVPKFDATSFTKTVTDVNGGGVRPGDVLEYLVTATNSGTDAATQTVIRDTLPANASYVAGSLQVVSGPNAGAKTDAAADDQMEYVAATRTVVARVGTGATAASGGALAIGAATSVRFRVQVTPPAPSGTTVSNQAAISCVGQVQGIAVNERSDGDAATLGVQPTVVTTVSSPIAGRVFEDVNYGGGAGRTLAAAAGAAVRNARVELYDAAGAFVTATASDSLGAWALDGWAPGAYTVRVVNSTVGSTRPGAVAGLLPVQTFRTDAASGTAVAVTDRVGGEVPAKADAASNTTAAALASLTTLTATPQSIAPVALGTATVGGVDFGFNFDTIVNVNDAGQGSLRQFLLAANALGDAGLAQAGLPAGFETAIFMVSDGAAHPGLRAGLANLLSGGVARITVTSAALPAITAASTRLDGGTQTARVGNSNSAALGAGGTVGADALALATLDGPEVEIRDAGGWAVGLDVQAANVTLAGLAILGFGNVPGSDSHADVRAGAAAASLTIDRCVLGATATSFTDPGGALRSGGDHLRVLGGDGGVVTASLIGFGAGSGVALTAGANGWQLTGDEIRGNAIGNPARAGVAIEGSGATVLLQCRIAANGGAGVDAASSTGANTFTSVTASGNGVGTGAGLVTAGLRLGGTGGSVTRCLVQDNFGAGVLVTASAAQQAVTRSSFARNGTVAGPGGPTGQIGIDLLAASDNANTGTAPFATRNDLGDADGGGNGLLNFPVIDSALVIAGTLTVSGWARPGSAIELFVSDGDPSGFGEGQTYATTLVEGSGADLDGTSSAYAGPIQGLDPGSDNTTRFRFVLPAPAGVVPGVRLTATATLAGATSEFSTVALVAGGVTVRGYAYADADHDASRDAGEAGTGAALSVKLVATGGTSATQVVAADPVTGAYALTSVAPGTWSLVLDTSAGAADVTPGLPAGWLGTEAAGGTRPVAVAATDLNDQSFGLWHGARADGRVFRDDGSGGGVANDGGAQAGEAGIAGARVRLLAAACAGGACDSTTTDGAGAYALWIPLAATGGSASVQESNVAGWLSTGGAPGTSGGAYARGPDATTFTPVAGAIASGVDFGDVPVNTFVAPGTAQAPGGGAATYAHRFTANSTGTVAFSVAEAPAPPIAGWSVTLVRDLDCDGVAEPGEPVISAPIALATGQQLCLVARHAVPAGAPNGALEVASLTASFTYTAAAPPLADALGLTDVTTVTAQGLFLAKSVSAGSARPGDALTYTIQYTNLGSQPLSGIVIHDATPAWTTFASAGCGALGGGLTGCSVSVQPPAGTTGPVSWSLAGALAPGASGSVTFVVQVQ